MVEFEEFKFKWDSFWNKRIAGETITFGDMERFMSRTSAKNLKLLMKGKKMEGYLEGSMDKMLSKRQTIALGVIVTIAMVGVIALVILKNQGMI